MDKRKKIAKQTEHREYIDAIDIIFKNRQIFLFDDVDNESAKEICSKIMALDFEETKPITLWIHSEGGEPDSAFAIINCMKTAKSPVNTVICNVACSAAAAISIAGAHRIAFPNSIWMQHQSYEGVEDYHKLVKDRMRHYDRLDKYFDSFMLNNSKLTERDVKKYQNGELWLIGKQLLQKGVVDEIMEIE